MCRLSLREDAAVSSRQIEVFLSRLGVLIDCNSSAECGRMESRTAGLAMSGLIYKELPDGEEESNQEDR